MIVQILYGEQLEVFLSEREKQLKVRVDEPEKR